VVRTVAGIREVTSAAGVLRQPHALVAEDGDRVEVGVGETRAGDAEIGDFVEIKTVGERVLVSAAGDEQAKLGVVADEGERRFTERAGGELVIVAEELDARLHRAG